MSHTRTRPRKHVYYSTELMTSVRGVHGHEPYCSCGWVGHTWKNPSTARSEASWHYANEHGDMSATGGTEAS